MSCSTTCTSSRGPQGDPGQSQYTYIGYASNALGANFSMVPSSSLKYMQILVSNTPILTPTLANFTGVWVKYIGDNGTNGTSGANGKDGANGAISFNYLWSDVTTSANPGSGYVKVNDTDVTAATALYISYEDYNGSAVNSVLAKLGTSTSSTKSIITIINVNDYTSFVSYEVTSSPISGGGSPGYYILTNLSYLSSYGTNPFDTGDGVIFSFSIAGDQGDSGTTILYNSVSEVSSTGTGSPEVLLTYTIPANTLTTNGSYYSVTAVAKCVNTFVGNPDNELIALYLNGTYIKRIAYAYYNEEIMFETTITRSSSTDARVITKVISNSGTISLTDVLYAGTYPFTSSLTVSLQATDLVSAPRAAYVTSKQLLIEKHIK